jgi:hypothetical protein
VPRSREFIIGKICRELQPSKGENAALAKQIMEHLKLFGEVSPRLRPIGNAAAISKAAREFRIKFRGTKLAKLLRETFPEKIKSPDGQLNEGIGPFEVIDNQLAWLEKIAGPLPQFDSSKALTGEVAVILVKNFSERPPREREKSLRAIVSWVHEFRTLEPDKKLKRVCDAAIKRAGW